MSSPSRNQRHDLNGATVLKPQEACTVPEFLQESTMQNFNVRDELAALREETRIIRKKPYHRSRLDSYTGELSQLYREGASAAELQRWLRKKRVRVVLSTVTRWLKRNGCIRQA